MAFIEKTPTFTEAEAVNFARRFYGLTVSAKTLPSYRDQNFRLTDAAARQFVLKIANADEKRDALVYEHRALKHLGAYFNDVRVPRVCPAAAGEEIVAITAAGGAKHLMRLLTYLPGQMLADAKLQSPALRRSLGRFLGELDKALGDMPPSNIDRDPNWTLKNAAWIGDSLHIYDSPKKQSIAGYFLLLFKTEAAPALPGLRQSIIHNDANIHNVLISAKTGMDHQVTGIIDFGDLTYTHTVSEVAIAAVYAMLGQRDPLDAAAQIVAGYHQTYPLTEAELAVLFPLMCMRLCVSVTMSAIEQRKAPENEYIAINERPAWQLLERLSAVNPNSFSWELVGDRRNSWYSFEFS